MKIQEAKWMFYFETGEIEIEVNYKNNLKDGEFKRWFKNGSLAIQSFYSHDKHIGSWKECYENGKVKETGEYRDNEYFPLNFWDEEGRQLLRDGTGKKIEKYGSSQLDIYEQYYENGNFVKEIKVSSVAYGKFIPKNDRFS